ncbi:MAG: topoisomerase IV [Oscillospiraceae bacterium]|nr:topoisomerase IV [Oscillospiraceae bacterium]
MAVSKRKTGKKDKSNNMPVEAKAIEQPITQTLESNYMPYAMSVIVSRAIPEIDGFKPSHRKLLYTMYKMGLLTGQRQKSANIVGRTMQLNPHGDAAIYETMVRLSTGNEALIAPFVDSKGNFGKVYSRDMSYAASRYTEAKLAPICNEIFKDIDKDTVDFTDSYDGTQQEPVLLPTAFPNILVSANSGIAVGMASMICGFNLNEVCEAAINYIKDPEYDLFGSMPAPDFSTGGEIIFDRAEMEEIYRTGKGSFKIRSKWRFIKEHNIIEIYEIPYTTTTDIIIDKISDLCKSGKIKEISDMRDETDLNGLKLAIELKRGTDPDKLMQKLFKLTTLQDVFSCNFNILVAGNPKVMGVKEILDEWTAWRTECLRRMIFSDIAKKNEKLHLLEGLEKILLDIDSAIEIIRNTELEDEVVPNLMMGFGIDETQAEFVANIKLRNINRQYILNRTSEIKLLKDEIEHLKEVLNSNRKIRGLIIDDLKRINKKYVIPRRSDIVYSADIEDEPAEPAVEDYPVYIIFTSEGYIKKLSVPAYRNSTEQKLKEGDSISEVFETSNNNEMIFFTDKTQAYKLRISDLEDSRSANLGQFIPAKLDFDEGEKIIAAFIPGDYSSTLLFVYENGKVSKVPMSSYATKSNRKKLINAYSDKSRLVRIIRLDNDCDIVLFTNDGRALLFNSAMLLSKAGRSSEGVYVLTKKKDRILTDAATSEKSGLSDPYLYKVTRIPSSGQALDPDDNIEKQLSFID